MGVRLTVIENQTLSLSCVAKGDLCGEIDYNYLSILVVLLVMLMLILIMQKLMIVLQLMVGNIPNGHQK